MEKHTILEKWLVIRNPAASKGAVARRWAGIEAAMQQAGLNMEAIATERPGHAIKLAMEGIKKGYRKLIAIGGDGTNNEVVNGILQQEVVASEQITYALLPVGTGNDWVKTHKIPGQLKDWLRMLQAGQTYFQDIGWVHFQNKGEEQKRYFVNIAGLAYDAYVARQMQQSIRRLPGTLYYMYMALKGFWGYQPTPTRVTFNKQQQEAAFYLINVGICRYSGGGMQLVPHAIPDDGLLALTLAANIGPLDFILNLPRIYLGHLHRHHKVQTHQTDYLRIESMTDQKILLEVDGEFIGESPMEMGVLSKALKMIVPPSG